MTTLDTLITYPLLANLFAEYGLCTIDFVWTTDGLDTYSVYKSAGNNTATTHVPGWTYSDDQNQQALDAILQFLLEEGLEEEYSEIGGAIFNQYGFKFEGTGTKVVELRIGG